MNTLPPLYFCLRIKEFAAQALLRLRPELRSRPVAVLDGAPPLEAVCGVNAPARQLSVGHGLSRAELASFPHLTILRRSLSEEQNARAALLEILWNFTPRIQLLPDFTDLVLALDMTGSERLFSSQTQAAQRATSATKQLGLLPRLVASANLHTAVCLSRTARETVTIIPAGEEAARLASLPIAALRPSAEHVDLFILWGLHTAGELAALSELDVVTRLGEEGRRLWRLARGEREHLLVPMEPEFTLAERIEFDAPVENLVSLLFVLRPMLDQLVLRAGQRALALASITVSLTLTKPNNYIHFIKPSLPLMDRAILLKLLHLDLEAHPPGAGILAVDLSAEPGARAEVQDGLFSPQMPEAARLEVTLARISALVGEGRVGRAVLQDTTNAQKTAGFVMERFSVGEKSGVFCRKSRKKAAFRPGSGVALRCLRPPLELAPQKEGPRPHRFVFDGVSYTVERAFGPWRRSGQWWTDEVWSREEWDVEAAGTNGARLLALLTHDLLRGSWQLEGLYD